MVPGNAFASTQHSTLCIAGASDLLLLPFLPQCSLFLEMGSKGLAWESEGEFRLLLSILD